MSAATTVLPEGDWIRGISIKQPRATCILTGAKTIENRFGQRRLGWKPGWVLLHAGQRTTGPRCASRWSPARSTAVRCRPAPRSG